MKIENNKIIEATETELFNIYLKRGYDDLFSFDFYKRRCIDLGTKIIAEKGRWEECVNFAKSLILQRRK